MSSTAKWMRTVIGVGRKHADPFGGSVHIETGRRGHPHLILDIAGKVRFLPISSSPGMQSQAVFSVERDIRRLVREMTQ
jgi:hypothetical protein